MKTERNVANTPILVPPPFMPIVDMKKFFGIKKKKAFRLLALGQIRGKKDGKAWIISTASIIRHVSRFDNPAKGDINV